MLQRDLLIAQMTPGRRTVGMFLKDGGTAFGVLDWMTENPSDGKPWLGVAMRHSDHHHRGFATEVLEELFRRLRVDEYAVVRAGVVARNAACLRLVQRLGFAEIAAMTVQMASTEDLRVFERLI